MFSVLLTATVWIPAKAVTSNGLDTFLSTGDQCLGSMIDRYIWVRGKDEDWQNKTLTRRYEVARKLYFEQSKSGFHTIFNGPWDRALVPIFEAQRDAILDSLLVVDTTGNLLREITYDEQGNILTLEAVDEYLRTGQSTQLVGLTQTVARAFGAKQKKIDEILNPTGTEAGYSSWAKYTAAISIACAQISVLQTINCTRATSDLLSEASYNSNMILPKIWMEFIGDPRLREGIRQSALILINRIKSKERGVLFEDLVSGFQGATFSKPEAVEAAWKLLALYGNGGPNTGYRLSAIELPNEASNMVVGLSVISTAISYLEFAQMLSQKSHYAFPTQASGCLTPKPYHFWLNAYFSRWLVKKGYSPDVAQMATYIVSKGYQVNRDINNAGGGLDKILSKPSDHPTNRVVRVDLTLAAAGSVYGSFIDKQKTIKSFSLVHGLLHLNEVRGETGKLSKDLIQNLMASDRMRLLREWDQLFRPNEALYYFRSQQD
ncbi:MAG: hypothetical protein IPJ71_09240 [Bdellovibrionales bacterium]|nr:hypothetical protein [Bdellovibrionales bacterium]